MRGPPTPALTRFTWTLPADTGRDSAPAVAPDGRHIAFTAKNATGVRRFIRDLGSLEARAVAGTDGATQPFWSPDSQSLAYFANGRLMKVALPDGIHFLYFVRSIHDERRGVYLGRLDRSATHAGTPLRSGTPGSFRQCPNHRFDAWREHARQSDDAERFAACAGLCRVDRPW